jgi:MarR-like DNA-binding transcriptional regulator SgrR of sgrS sRNA
VPRFELLEGKLVGMTASDLFDLLFFCSRERIRNKLKRIKKITVRNNKI